MKNNRYAAPDPQENVYSEQGGNAVFLAKNRFKVEALDISSEAIRGSFL